MLEPVKNIVLIGMPGVGKSTIGVLLAKAASRPFVDTDLLIQAAEGVRLQDIIDEKGLNAFLEIEERRVLELDCTNAVIATGGSVVYSPRVMDRLKRGGVVVYLELPLDELERRVVNMGSRGIVIAPGQTFASLYAERTPLYHQYADVIIPCAGLTHEQAVDALLRALGPLS
jgi:shikimate kinase